MNLCRFSLVKGAVRGTILEEFKQFRHFDFFPT